jgi:hypothetical protein
MVALGFSKITCRNDIQSENILDGSQFLTVISEQPRRSIFYCELVARKRGYQ